MKNNEKLVLNTSSGLFFTKIGLIPHLFNHFQIITSAEIAQEIKEGEDLGFKDAKILNHYLTTKKLLLKNAKTTEHIAKNFKIKNTDASVIALAQENSCTLTTEDQQIEKICLATQTPVVNSAALIYFLWQNKEFKTSQTFLLLELLLKNGYNKEICLKIKEKIFEGEQHV